MDIILPTSLLAIALGLAHAFEADHVAAVSTLVTRSGGTKGVTLLGALWGVGHTTTLLVVGIILLALKVTVPPELSILFETIVAIILIMLGIDTIKKVKDGRIHAHAHTHGGKEHAHLHVHHIPKVHDHGHAPFVIGLFHGLAGSGALALAAVASTKTLTQGALFIGLFGLGSIVGMTLLSATLGYIMLHTARFARLHEALMLASGTLCIVVALTLIPIGEIITRIV